VGRTQNRVRRLFRREVVRSFPVSSMRAYLQNPDLQRSCCKSIFVRAIKLGFRKLNSFLIEKDASGRNV